MQGNESLILATSNKNKVKELKVLLRGFNVIEPNRKIEVTESGSTIEENAILKAQAYCKEFDLPALGEDTGLFIDILNGEPGVYSARYAGENATDLDNVKLVLRKISEFSHMEPFSITAQFRTVVALAQPNGRITSREGNIKGYISKIPKGSNGFGYDVIFIPEENNPKSLTYAEMTLEEKNATSHRAKAVNLLIKDLIS